MRLLVGLAVCSARRGKLAGLADRETAQFIRAGTKGEPDRLPQVVPAEGVQSACAPASWRAGALVGRSITHMPAALAGEVAAGRRK